MPDQLRHVIWIQLVNGEWIKYIYNVIFHKNYGCKLNAIKRSLKKIINNNQKHALLFTNQSTAIHLLLPEYYIIIMGSHSLPAFSQILFTLTVWWMYTCHWNVIRNEKDLWEIRRWSRERERGKGEGEKWSPWTRPRFQVISPNTLFF